jgi:hypothetical protein
VLLFKILLHKYMSNRLFNVQFPMGQRLNRFTYAEALVDPKVRVQKNVTFFKT